MEFATEIGQNLLVEVRRLQALLTERDKALERAQEERDASEQEKGILLAAVRSAETSVGKCGLLSAKGYCSSGELNVRTIQRGKLESRSFPTRDPFHLHRHHRTTLKGYL